MSHLAGERVLITGAKGSIGTALHDHLLRLEPAILPTDREDMDVRDEASVLHHFEEFRPTLVFHLAGAKHAPLGEEDPEEAARVNITGTQHVLDAAFDVDARVVTASTCKACNPETAYGATKLIAERMTLNSGGSVARFYNVRETCGNVFDIWRQLPEDEPIPVTVCKRRFMSLEQAIHLLMSCATLDPGRYTVANARSEDMWRVAAELYPDRGLKLIEARRGDRLDEPAWASHEQTEVATGGILRVTSPHDALIPAVTA